MKFSEEIAVSPCGKKGSGVGVSGVDEAVLVGVSVGVSVLVGLAVDVMVSEGTEGMKFSGVNVDSCTDGTTRVWAASVAERQEEIEKIRKTQMNIRIL